MPPRELGELVSGARRPGRDRFVLQMPPDIGGQLRRRPVPTVFFFLERLVDDRLEVAAKGTTDRAEALRISCWIDLIASGYRWLTL